MTTLIIDKHPIVRKGLALILKDRQPNNVVISSEHLPELYQNLPGLKLDLVILGVAQFSEENFVQKLRATLIWSPDIKVIIYDYQPDPRMAKLYLQNGAMGYLSKEDNIDDLVHCINDVAKGTRFICKAFQSDKFNKINYHSEPVRYRRPNMTILTKREFEIATYLTMGMRTSAIAVSLNRKPSTISTIKHNIYSKLEVDNVISLIKKLSRLSQTG